MTEAREGGCQCGAVRYRVSGEPLAVSICHCTDCQRQSGSAFGMSWIVVQEKFQLLQGEVKKFTKTSDRGRPVHCAFCPECGTRIFHEPQYLEGVVNLKPGTLDDTSPVRPDTEVWTARRQPWIQLSAEVKSHEKQPF